MSLSREPELLIPDELIKGIPCPHFIRGFKRMAPSVCPWCKVLILRRRIEELEALLERREVDFSSIKDDLFLMKEDLEKMKSKPILARLRSVFSGLKGSWKKGGISKER